MVLATVSAFALVNLLRDVYPAVQATMRQSSIDINPLQNMTALD
jgi:hypothetical protein